MSIEQLIDPFYRDLPAETFRKELIIGQLCWIPTLHLNKIPMIMEVERADPKEAYATKFQVRNLSEKDFRGWKPRDTSPISAGARKHKNQNIQVQKSKVQ
jgi:hypothetical protein